MRECAMASDAGLKELFMFRTRMAWALSGAVALAACSGDDAAHDHTSGGAGGAAGTTSTGGSGGNAAGKGGTAGTNATGGKAGATGGSGGAAGGKGGTAGAGGSTAGSGGSSGTQGDSGTGNTGTACPSSPPAGLPDGPLTRNADNPVMRNGPEAYDFDKAGPRVILKEGTSEYRMWYEAVASGLATGVAHATSRDGIEWTKEGVVFEPSSTWEGNEVSPHTILVENGTYRLWYHAGGVDQPHRNIGYATSTDGMTWQRRSEPVLTVGDSGSFDDDEAAEPRVFAVDGGYRMYYTGANEGRRKSLGMATSSDGIEWTKSEDNPIMDSERWGNYWGGAFFHEDGFWHLWHASDSGMGQLNYAWSRDGISWNDGDKNPVLEPSGDADQPDGVYLGDSVSGFRDGDSYRILYTGYADDLFGSEGRFEGICMASVRATCPEP
jgi:predicted GH43/DUF377 family glycosyl hydrolase